MDLNNCGTELQKQLKEQLNVDFSIDKASKKHCKLYGQYSEKQFLIHLIPPIKDEHERNEVASCMEGKTAFIVVYGEYSKDIVEFYNIKKIPVLFAYDFEHGTHIGFIVNFIETSLAKFPLFDDVFEIVERKIIQAPQYYEHKASSLWARYRNYNTAISLWTPDEIKKATWEVNLFSSVLKPKQSIHSSGEKFKGRTFASSVIWKNSEGVEICQPDLDKMRTEDGLAQYFFERFQKSNAVFLKRRYLEFLFFMNDKKHIIIPASVENLLQITIEEIHFIEAQQDWRISELPISLLWQRFLEILSTYKAPLGQEKLKKYLNYYKDYIQSLYENNKYRWILDLCEYPFLYTNLIEMFTEQEFTNYLKMLEEGYEFFLSEKNAHLAEKFQLCISVIKKRLKQDYDESTEIAKTKLFEACQHEAQGNYLVGNHFLEEAILLFSKNSKNEKKVRELKELQSKWAKLAVGEMRPIEVKIPIDTEKLKEEHRNYVGFLANMNESDRIAAFFSDNNLFLTEDIFLRLYSGTKDSISSLLPLSIQDERGTIKRATTDDDALEMKEFHWYGICIKLYLEKFLDIWNMLFSQKILTPEMLINYIENCKSIINDDKDFIKEALSLYKINHNVASLAISIPMIERFFRNLVSYTPEKMKHKDEGIEQDVSLDKMIKESIRAGFPPNLCRLYRYLYSRKDCLNLRNKFAHGFVPFSYLNSEMITGIVLWCLISCYINVEEIHE